MSVKFTFATRVKPISSAHPTATATASSKSTTSTHRSVQDGSTRKGHTSVFPLPSFQHSFQVSLIMRMWLTFPLIIWTTRVVKHWSRLLSKVLSTHSSQHSRSTRTMPQLMFCFWLALQPHTWIQGSL